MISNVTYLESIFVPTLVSSLPNLQSSVQPFERVLNYIIILHISLNLPSVLSSSACNCETVLSVFNSSEELSVNGAARLPSLGLEIGLDVMISLLPSVKISSPRTWSSFSRGTSSSAKSASVFASLLSASKKQKPVYHHSYVIIALLVVNYDIVVHITWFGWRLWH